MTGPASRDGQHDRADQRDDRQDREGRRERHDQRLGRVGVNPAQVGRRAPREQSGALRARNQREHGRCSRDRLCRCAIVEVGTLAGITADDMARVYPIEHAGTDGANYVVLAETGTAPGGPGGESRRTSGCEDNGSGKIAADGAVCDGRGGADRDGAMTICTALPLLVGAKVRERITTRKSAKSAKKSRKV